MRSQCKPPCVSPNTATRSAGRKLRSRAMSPPVVHFSVVHLFRAVVQGSIGIEMEGVDFDEVFAAGHQGLPRRYHQHIRIALAGLGAPYPSAVCPSRQQSQYQCILHTYHISGKDSPPSYDSIGEVPSDQLSTSTSQ